MLTLLLATVDTAHAADAAGPLEGLKQTFMHFGVEPKYSSNTRSTAKFAPRLDDILAQKVQFAVC